MFARTLSIHLKPNSVTAFGKVFADEVLPSLRKQAGFCDELAFVNDNDNHITAISLWDSREAADAYQTSGQAQAITALTAFIDGVPKVRTSRVVSSALHVIEPASV